MFLEIHQAAHVLALEVLLILLWLQIHLCKVVVYPLLLLLLVLRIFNNSSSSSSDTCRQVRQLQRMLVPGSVVITILQLEVLSVAWEVTVDIHQIDMHRRTLQDRVALSILPLLVMVTLQVAEAVQAVPVLDDMFHREVRAVEQVEMDYHHCIIINLPLRRINHTPPLINIIILHIFLHIFILYRSAAHQSPSCVQNIICHLPFIPLIPHPPPIPLLFVVYIFIP
jgi:hypothetical protein